MKRASGALMIGLAVVMAAPLYALTAAAVRLPMAYDPMDIDMPQPGGVIAQSPQRYHVQLGLRALEVEGFVTELEAYAVQDFYRRALPSEGWRLAALPWQAREQRVMADLERVIAAGATTDPLLHERLKRMRDTQQSFRNQLYASQGASHVIVHLLPLTEGTMVFINRWTGAGFEAAEEVPASGRQPANVCCSADAVTEAPEQAAFDAPVYPQARVAATAVTPDRLGATIVSLSRDTPEAVVSYYLAAMPQRGWQLAQRQAAASGDGERDARVLSFVRQRSVCEVVIQQPRKAMSDSQQDMARTTIVMTISPREN